MTERYPRERRREPWEERRTHGESARKRTPPRRVDCSARWWGVRYGLQGGFPWRMLPNIAPQGPRCAEDYRVGSAPQDDPAARLRAPSGTHMGRTPAEARWPAGAHLLPGRAEGGYAGAKLATATPAILGGTGARAQRNALPTCEVIPKRWVVERAGAWRDQGRRLWTHCARTINTAVPMTVLAFLVLLLKRL